MEYNSTNSLSDAQNVMYTQFSLAPPGWVLTLSLAHKSSERPVGPLAGYRGNTYMFLSACTKQTPVGCGNSEMMCFYGRGWLCSGMTINPSLWSTAKCHLLLSGRTRLLSKQSADRLINRRVCKGVCCSLFLHPVNTHSFYSHRFYVAILSLCGFGTWHINKLGICDAFF